MKIAVIGFGSRGSLYTRLYADLGVTEIAAVCDIRRERLDVAKQRYGLSDDRLFLSDAEFFAKGKLADLYIVATPDACHKAHALAALKLGADLQLEKPIARSPGDCNQIYRAAKKLGRKIFVCHVLRYAPFFSQIKRELNGGRYGRVSTVDMTENVAYWHQAHSYVRGNWRDTDKSSPMIVAKCCHDLDILAWLINERCKAVSSMGSLDYFKAENAPEGSAQRCLECTVKDCPYNAERYYIGECVDKNYFDWPVDVLAVNPTRESVYEALKTGPYGRCVFKCDNNAVDHQVADMLFESGATAHLTMTAFSKDCYRKIHVHCQKGEIYGDMRDNKLVCNIFGGESKIIDTAKSGGDGGFGHGGGDYLLVKDIAGLYAGQEATALTDIENSMQSHIIGFAAEKSRLNGGKLIKI
ncbi:MAG: Gfo/Idh/MocA family oxidoreductase [Clostridiales bacterium]|jgi:predicted dehydrogenase|nr:Gfo/Idh/MocA family oxidoreductase [Clostridiales bacterium]